MTYISLDPQLEAKVRMGEHLRQGERVLVMLRDAGAKGVCGTTFTEERVPRYSARIGELRKAGWDIPKRRCGLHGYHTTAQWVWVLAAPGEDATLF